MFVRGYCVYEVPQVYLYTIDYSKNNIEPVSSEPVSSEPVSSEPVSSEPTTNTIDNFATSSTTSVKRISSDIEPPKTTRVKMDQTPDMEPPFVPEDKDKYILIKIIIFLVIVFIIMNINVKKNINNLL